MASPKRVRVLFSPIATEDEVERLESALARMTPPLSHERGDRSLVISLPVGSRPEEVSAKVEEAMDTVTAQGFVHPPRIERWRAHSKSWVDIGPGPQPHRPPPAPDADSIGWKVYAAPIDAFRWQALREEVERLGRPVLDEKEHELVLGASDETDAKAVIRELERLGCVRSTRYERLGRLGRWRVRQQLLGNYGSETVDPSQRF